MSSIEASGNADLYDELGIADLNRPQIIDEDPVLSKLGPTVWDPEAFVAFFREKDFEGSPAEGYSVVAEDFRKDLEGLIVRIADAADKETKIPENVRLPVMPVKKASGEVESIPIMREKFESPGYRAYLAQIELMLRLRIVASQAEPDGSSRTLSVGRYLDRQGKASSLYLLESQSVDEGGRYTELFLRSHPPSDMLPTTAPDKAADKPFFPSGVEEAAVLDLYREIDFLEHGVVPTHEDLEANVLPPPPPEDGRAPEDPVDVIKALVYHLRRAA